MEENRNFNSRPSNPRRKKRTKMQIFKEAYLPIVIGSVALILIVIFIIGSASRSSQKKQLELQASIAASESVAAEEARLAAEETTLLAEAERFAADYYYDNAIDILNSFSGNMGDYPRLAEKINEYTQKRREMVLWDDPSQIVNLSFHLLMADPTRAFAHDEYGSAFNRNYVTTGEFERILQQLYDNGYMLIRLTDMLSTETTAEGDTVIKAGSVFLPADKKPLILTETNANYNIYMVDGDGDKLPDKDGAGFASKLLVDDSGNFFCEMVDANGQIVQGAYDMVPILEEFIAEHPDFSYRSARATIALTGYNGLFGHRTYKGAESDFGSAIYNDAVAQATKVANALRDRGYVLACYTYDNIGYGNISSNGVKADLDQWISEALPILGSVDTIVYAQQSDIQPLEETYSGSKYDVLRSAGFRYYIGFANGGNHWTIVRDAYVRMGRILVSGSNMEHHKGWFDGMFDPSTVLDYDLRGNIPS